MKAILNAVDMSKWGGELTIAEAKEMIAAGIDTIIVGTGNPVFGGAGQWSRQQLSTWKQAGGKRSEVYIYLYMAGDPVAQVKNGLSTCSGFDIKRWWLDAEDTESPELNAGQRTRFLNDCIAALIGHHPSHNYPSKLKYGIYTGQWWWKPQMNNSSAFKHLDLWDSWYPTGSSASNPIYQPWAGREYGGWEQPAIYQFTNTTTLAGQSVDLNYIVKFTEGEDELAQEVVDELIALINDERADNYQLFTQLFGEKVAAQDRIGEYVKWPNGELVTIESIMKNIVTLQGIPSGGGFDPDQTYKIIPA
jgi:hypothetical protein